MHVHGESIRPSLFIEPRIYVLTILYGASERIDLAVVRPNIDLLYLSDYPVSQSVNRVS